MTRRRRKEKEVHQIQESLLLEVLIEERNYFTLNATIVIRKATMLEISLRRTMDHVAILEATTSSMIKKRRYDQRNDHNGRDERRRRSDAPSNHEEDRHPQKKSRFSMYESNDVNQFEYILISALTISYPPNSWDSWLVDSGATHHFSSYKEVLSNLVDRESNLKIILGDNSTHPIKGFGSVKFYLNSR